jgi:hypothetical protein
MGNDMVERSLAAFYAIIGRLGVKLEDDSPIKKDFDTTRELVTGKLNSNCLRFVLPQIAAGE